MSSFCHNSAEIIYFIQSIGDQRRSLILLLFFVGIAVGLVSSFFGVGGGVLIVPALYTFFPQMPAQAAIGTSLGLIFFNSCLNVFNFARSGQKPPKDLVIQVGLGCLIGVGISSQLVFLIPGPMVKKFFGGFLLLLSARLFLQRIKKQENHESNDYQLPSWKKSFPTGICGGFVSGMTGLGGGVAMVPLFISILRMPSRMISPVSNGAMIFATVGGLILFSIKEGVSDLSGIPFAGLQVGFVNFGIVAILFAGTNISSRIGVKLNDKIKPQHKEISFAILLLLIGLRILFS